MRILCAATQPKKAQLPSGVEVQSLQKLPERWSHYRSVFGTKRAAEVAAAAEDFKPDIVHFHTVSRQLGYKWIALTAQKKIPIVATAHDVSHVACGKVTGFEKHLWLRDFTLYRWQWNPFRTFLIRRFFRSVHTTMCVSDALKDYLHRWQFERLTTVHNGISASFWQPQDKQAARSQLKLDPHAFYFLLAGRIGHDKGALTMIHCLPQNARLLLAGETAMELFAPIADRTDFLPKQTADQMRAVYAACDVAVVPSLCLDCFPTVCLEAMACAKPVIATSWGGAKESVADGITGWIIDPTDEPANAKRMQQCANEPATLELYGTAGRERFTAFFTVEKMAAAIQEAYAQCMRQ